jgi:hypothetical protein
MEQASEPRRGHQIRLTGEFVLHREHSHAAIKTAVTDEVQYVPLAVQQHLLQAWPASAGRPGQLHLPVSSKVIYGVSQPTSLLCYVERGQIAGRRDEPKNA